MDQLINSFFKIPEFFIQGNYGTISRLIKELCQIF